ncbi:MAG: hypothetical protein Q7S40_00865, partial [Opitutaceae bacterium]|nr:hypothetical protein [Opitutaceae bacterium]
MKRLFPSRRGLRWWATLWLLLSGFASAAEDAAVGPVIELPKFIVTDTRELPPPEQWRYGTIAGFEVLSNASDRATQRLLRDFDMFRQALGHVWPIRTRISHSTALIICGRKGKFDAFVPGVRLGPDVALASLMLKKDDHTAIVIDMQATTLNILNIDGLNDAATGTDSGLISVEHDKQLYREYVRYLLSQMEPRAPAWFEEGLSQIIMKMQFDRKWIEFARLEDPNTVSAQAAMTAELNALATADDPDAATLPGAPAEDRDFNAALNRRALVPFERFFAVKHDSAEAISPLGNNRWAKQAYAFVHMCLYGYNGKYQKQFTTLLARSAREPVTETMFKECFNMSYKQMLMQIRSYVEFTVYQHREYRSKTDVILPPPPLVLRDATESEVGRIKGEALLAAGHKAAARRELIAPYVRGERDPKLLAALGLFEHAEGEKDRARKFLEASVAAKADRPSAFLELARIRYDEALAKPAGPDKSLSAAQANSVINLLLAARKQPPPMPAVYELLADTWVRSSVTPKRDDVTILAEGVQLFPGRLKLTYQTAALCATAGVPEAAHSLVDHGIRIAPDANSR